jgi:hypothetical protein
VFTRALHWSLSWARWIHSIPSHPISLRSILILSNHLRFGLPRGLFPYGFATNILYTFLFSSIRATCPAYLTLLNLEKSTCYEAPHYAVFSKLLSLHLSVYIHICVCVCVCIWTLIAPVRLQRFYSYSASNRLATTGACTMNTNLLVLHREPPLPKFRFARKRLQRLWLRSGK